MPDCVLKFSPEQARRIALGLRGTEFLLQRIAEGTITDEERTPEMLAKRQEQLLWLAGQIERAVKAAQPILPAHERPQQRNRKVVWCQGKGCQQAITRAEAAANPLCPTCQSKAV